MVHFSEAWPVFTLVDVHKSGKVIRGIIADVFASSFLCGVQEEVSDALVDSCNVLELSYEWTNVLESCASHNLRGGVLKELEIELLHGV